MGCADSVFWSSRERTRSARRVQVTLRMLWGQELADEAPAARPLRRRAAMLVGAWAPKLALADRPAAYRALLGLLARQNLLFKSRLCAPGFCLVTGHTVIPCFCTCNSCKVSDPQGAGQGAAYVWSTFVEPSPVLRQYLVTGSVCRRP